MVLNGDLKERMLVFPRVKILLLFSSLVTSLYSHDIILILFTSEQPQ